MRATLGSLLCFSTLASLACAAPASFAVPASAALQPTYHLHGYYELHETNVMWQFSNNSPWQVVKDDPWIDPKLVKWGYVPIVHGSDHYYCVIDKRPRTGTNILKKTFTCGDPKTAALIFINNN
jgi:hypothetical protein